MRKPIIPPNLVCEDHFVKLDEKFVDLLLLMIQLLLRMKGISE